MAEKKDKTDAQKDEVGKEASKPVEATASLLPEEPAGFLRQHWPMIKIALCVVIINVVITLSSMAVYDRYFATKIAVVDIEGFRKHQKDLFFEGKINQEELKDSLEQYVAAINNVKANTVLFFPNGAIFKNGRIIEP